MKLISILILTISISSCKTLPLLKEPFVRCGAYLKEKSPGLYSGKCRCHLYEITPDNIGRISESKDYPLNHCNNSVVLRPVESWAPLRTWWEDLMFFYNQNKHKIKKENDDFLESFEGESYKIVPRIKPLDDSQEPEID